MKKSRPRKKRLIRRLIEGIGTVIITGIRLWRVARSPHRRRALPHLLWNGVLKFKPLLEPIKPAWQKFDDRVFCHVRRFWTRVIAFHRQTPVPRLRRLYMGGIAIAFVLVVSILWLASPRFVERDPQQALAKLMEETANLIAQKRLNKADQKLAELKKLAPDHPTVLTFSGALKSLRKDYVGARWDYLRVLEKSPDDFNAMFNLGELDFVTGHYQTAAGQFRRMLETRPQEEVVIFRLYLCELLQGHDHQANEYLATLSTAGVTPAHYYAEAARLFRDKKKSEARKLVVTARTLYPDKTAFFEATFDTLGYH